MCRIEAYVIVCDGGRYVYIRLNLNISSVSD